MPRGTQSIAKTRDYVFTINNPTNNDTERLRQHPASVSYIIYGIEVGEGGTSHFQGFIQFQHPVSFGRCKSVVGDRAHIESRRGTVVQAIEYCKKDGNVVEYGSPQRLQTNSEKQKEKWQHIIKLAEQNKLDELKEEYPSYYIRYLNTLKSLSYGKDLIITELQNEWWYGPTGTGKSYSLWQKYPQHYQKELNKWWCGYTGQEIVAIEEWCPKNECTASQLKIWADRYPFTAQIKGGSLQKIRPMKIIVLSNYSIDQCFTNPEDRDPIKRRFKEVHYQLPYYPAPRSASNPPHGGPASSPLPTGGNTSRESTVELEEDIDINLDFLDELIL
ncbi:MAG: putative viral replication protein [Cressdnaviricota sp.]|nr:MAG: putative viral replication protein [Cressdnaviricota sp.]